MLESRESKLFIIALLCCTIFLGDRFLFDPVVKSWQEKSQAIQELEAKVESGKQVADSQDAWQKRMDEMTACELPENTSDAESKVFRVLSEMAAKSRVSVQGRRLQWNNPEPGERQGFTIRISGKGSLKAVSRYIYEIEACESPLKIKFSELRSSDRKGSRLSFDLEVSGIIPATGSKEGA